LLIALFLPYISPKITRSLLAVFAYPKLYGAIGILGLLLFAANHSSLTGKNDKKYDMLLIL
jgi:hypothetical protein